MTKDRSGPLVEPAVRFWGRFYRGREVAVLDDQYAAAVRCRLRTSGDERVVVRGQCLQRNEGGERLGARIDAAQDAREIGLDGQVTTRDFVRVAPMQASANRGILEAEPFEGARRMYTPRGNVKKIYRRIYFRS